MTREQLEECYSLRKEWALTKRRLEACKNNSKQEQRMLDKAALLQSKFDAVEDFIDSIPDSLSRQIATLHYIEGLTYKETGAYVGFSVPTVRRYLRKLLPDSADTK